MTASVWINGPAGRVKIRALLDLCANNSFVSRRVAEAVGLIVDDKEPHMIGGFNGNLSGPFFRTEEYVSGHSSHHNIPFSALVTDKICNPIQRVPSGPWMEQMKSLKMMMADPCTDNSAGDIDLLIGADLYWKIVTGKNFLLKDGPMAVESLFGWILSGQLVETGTGRSSKDGVVMLSLTEGIKNEVAYKELQQMLEIESIDTVNSDPTAAHGPTGEMAQFEKEIEHTGQQYKVRLLWKDPCPDLPSNEGPVKKQLSRLVQSLEKTPGLLERYDGGIKELLDRGFIEEISPHNSTGNPVHYLAHHPVIKEERATTKLRIVFDASGKQKDPHPSTTAFSPVPT